MKRRGRRRLPLRPRVRAVVVHDRMPHSITMPTARPALLLREAGAEVHVVDIGPRGRDEDEGVLKWHCSSRVAAALRVATLRPDFLFLEGSTWHLMLLPLSRRSWVRATGRSERPVVATAERLMIRAASVVSVSNPDHAERWQLPKGRLLELAYPVDIDFWSAPVERSPEFWQRRGLPTPPGPVVTYVAQLMKRKRQTEMVSALAPVLRDRPDVRLVFAGAPVEPGAEDALRATAKGAGVAEQVHVLGPVSPPEELRQLYAWTTVHAVNSAWETQCMVVYESLAAGVANAVSALPVLTTAFPDVPAHEDDDALRRNVVHLLDDAEARAAVVRESRDRLRWADIRRHDEVFRSTVTGLLQ